MKNHSPSESPISFEKALRIAVGGEEVAERFRVFRAWWRSELERVAKSTGGRLADNVDEMVEFFRTNGVDKSWLNNFIAGIAEYKKIKRTERFTNLANARWKKNKPPGGRKKVLVRG